jgi:hypothetical protein
MYPTSKTKIQQVALLYPSTLGCAGIEYHESTYYSKERTTMFMLDQHHAENNHKCL